MEQNAENNSIPEQKTVIEETKQPKVKKQLPIGAVLKTILIIVVLISLFAQLFVRASEES